MLTDAALKALKPKDKVYKVSDRDGMYARVTPTGLISFSLDYRLNGRRETVYLGRYGRDGISLARAAAASPDRVCLAVRSQATWTKHDRLGHQRQCVAAEAGPRRRLT